MAWEQTPYTVLFAGVTVLLLAAAVVSFRHREAAGATPLAVLSAATAVWAATAALGVARTDPGGLRAFANLAFVGVSLVPVAFLFFAVEYANRDVWLTRYGPLPLLVVPVLTQLVVWTNPSHQLMWTRRVVEHTGSVSTLAVQYGPWFWFHSAYSYLLTLVGTYLLVRTYVVSETVFRSQSAAVLVGVMAPWLSNALYVSGLLSVPIDPTPVAFSVTAVAFLIAIYRHKLLELMPVAREIARDELLDNLVEAVFILDDRGCISDFNEPARHIAGEPAAAIVGEPIDEVVPGLADALTDVSDETLSEDDTGTEVALRQNGTLRHYDVRVTELRRGGGLLRGRLVSLQDVTDRRQREQRLDVLNRALRHDLRNEANVILGYAELGMQNHPDAEWVQAIQHHVSGMVDLSAKVRQIEQALDGENVESRPIDVAAAVREVVAEIEAERPDLSIDTALPDSAHASAIELVDSAISNALENAIEHNDNPDPLVEVSVSVWLTDAGDVAIEITDNGPGIHEDEREVLLRGRETQLDHVSGLGLWIINWIVTESGGTIAIDENEPRGSVVTLHLPAAENPPESEAAVADPASTGQPTGDVDRS
ncbi:histidine kinase N-terminal 7TM domain-containing protein [Halorientalis brevis]|uniref:histidine kinase n=1 Tax=Halorientalis brevis TaxID=1126241 RepID=A0ABD6C660_9EURY|nr:histidine kinase N-terminal 7TM domain-containing protein [Halorientalis brevis]